MKMAQDSSARNIALGIAVGASMMLPGVSGGTMAIILGVYDRLIRAISGIFQDFRANFIFLFQFGMGGMLGILFLSRIMERLLGLAYLPMMYFFGGAVLGSIPLLAKKAGIGDKGNPPLWEIAAFVGAGLGGALLLAFLPSDQIGAAQGTALYLQLFIVGAVVSVALVLPGISTSYMLLVLGIYQPTIYAINTMDIPFIAGLGLGLLAGTFVITKLLAAVMARYPKQTYLAIIGFVLAALKDVYPGMPKGADWIWSTVALAMGIGSVLWLSRRTPE